MFMGGFTKIYIKKKRVKISNPQMVKIEIKREFQLNVNFNFTGFLNFKTKRRPKM